MAGADVVYCFKRRRPPPDAPADRGDCMNDTLTPISPWDARAQKQVDSLLEQEGIRRDGNLDYTCGLFDEDWKLAATGSCFGNTIRCLAVDRGRQGEGLLNQITTHLMEVQTARGNTHLFPYTKPQSAKFFGDLGFWEIARVENSLVFMENRRRGFSDYLAALEKTRREGRSAAIVMNANPFTLGHLHLAEKAEEKASHTTALYNEEMVRLLPELGIECKVAPRFALEGRPVSASTVRQAIHQGRLEDIRPLVPEATWSYFSSPLAAPVVEAIQREKDVIHY